MDKFEIGRVLHMCMTKPFLHGLIDSKHGADLIKDWKMSGVEEAHAALNADPREVITIGDCDNQDSTGQCQGHDPKD